MAMTNPAPFPAVKKVQTAQKTEDEFVRARVPLAICVFLTTLMVIPWNLHAHRKGGTLTMPVSLQMRSSAFSAGERIPKKYTCDGSDLSPNLAWGPPPARTQSFALIMDDPDAPAGTWVHWVLYELPANTQELPEGVAKEEQLAGGARQGRNDFGKLGYGGPCPPPGKSHRYFFKLYALDTKLGLKAGATKADVEGAVKGHILAQAELVGTYGR
jgi:Raf kinase inhibitor-like YbhB/YbcL family protein